MDYDLHREEPATEGTTVFRSSARWGTLRHLLLGLGLIGVTALAWRIAWAFPPAREEEVGIGETIMLGTSVVGFLGVIYVSGALFSVWKRSRLEIDVRGRRIELIESAPFRSRRRELPFKSIAAVWLRNDSFGNQPECRSWRVTLEVQEQSAVDLGQGPRDPAEALARRFASLMGAPIKGS
ncbi:MAG: hypothetical protein HY293_14650 [Planctomycetes bacterium]|nr:hypothetical protein [Planctomycetota bacterium]